LKIANAIITDYLACKYKAYLLASNIAGQRSDYEEFFNQRQLKYIRAATGAPLDLVSRTHYIQSKPITVADLEKGVDALSNVCLETDQLQITVHYIKRVPGISSLGPFHYEPALFSADEEGRNEPQIIMLSMACLALERMQRFRPEYGTLISGAAYKPRRIHLKMLQAKAEVILRHLSDVLAGISRPPLRINDHCRVCRYQSICLAEARQTDDLSLLRRISDKEILSYNSKGITTINQLSHTFRFRRRGKRVKARGRPHSFPLQALALREQSVFVVSPPELPQTPIRLYVDMEGNQSGSFVYLIGVLRVENATSTYQHFWADTESDGEQLLRRFWEYLAAITDNAHIFYYGHYEARVLRRIIKQLGTKTSGDLLLKNSTNVLSLIYANIYFPTYSNGLKEIATYLGFAWSPPAVTGLNAIIWRYKWESARDNATKDILLAYNRDDCVALEKLIDFIAKVSRFGDPQISNDDGIRFVEQIKSDGYNDKFGKQPAAIREFAEITERAYFDYQRDRIYIRTNDNFKEIRRRKKRNERRKSVFRVNKHVTLKSRVCPRCRSLHITRDWENYHSRETLDLRFSPSGVRRWVTRYRSPFHFCNDCIKWFVPPTLRKISRFGHGVRSWTMDQQIGNRITLQNLERTAKDHFALPIRYSQIHKFKQEAGEYYKRTYNIIMRNIIKGPIIHCDETKVDLQAGSGYVWVFTNMEEVIYVYRSGRDADFLHETLEGFSGVLISDFYTGYDSLPCFQQKCLVHLIRDINADLLKHPFDQELKAIALQFGKLIRSIMGTVDRCGLRRQRLQRHATEVQCFIGALENRAFTSEAAGKYSKRILKYRTKLFTFMDFDGVPWNNNNAEHAIKPFAKYRRLINGQITENGLRPCLILLSIHQTCKYKEISFLEFMLSGERSIDTFIARS
jgi:predicted RecB family nuclease